MDGEITPDELKGLLDADEAVRIVDIRPAAQFRRGHIPGSESIPFHELPQRVESLDGADRVVTVCPLGKSSVQAARLIKSYEGTTTARVESLAGGLDEWDHGLEAEGEETATTDEGPESPF